MIEYIKLFWEGAPEGEPSVILYEVDTGNERLALRSIDIFADGRTRNIPDFYEDAILAEYHRELSCCPKPSQSKNLAVVNHFLFHLHFSCICLSSFTIRSRFFAVFIKVGRWSAWVIFALPGGFSRRSALR